MGGKILIIEDNRELAELIAMHLRDLSHEAKTAFEGESGLKAARSERFDLVILDLMLPGIDGLEICRRMRDGTADYIPILMLTSKASEIDRVLGLEMGADDYVTKPFSIRELMARVKAIFRRIENMKPGRTENRRAIKAGDLVIEPEKRSVLKNGAPVALTAREFDLLLHFARNPGTVFTRSRLLDRVWGYGHDGYEHTVNSHINRLRAKIEEDPSNPGYILTVWGVGYKFSEMPDRSG